METDLFAAKLFDLPTVNAYWGQLSPREIVCKAWEHFKSGLVMSSHFNRESAMLLHLVTSIPVMREIPILYIVDPETQPFSWELRRKLQLQNLQSSSLSKEGKLATLQQKLRDNRARAIMHGSRAYQTKLREKKDIVELGEDGFYRIYPLLQLTPDAVDEYILEHNLPFGNDEIPATERQRDCELMCYPTVRS